MDALDDQIHRLTHVVTDIECIVSSNFFDERRETSRTFHQGDLPLCTWSSVSDPGYSPVAWESSVPQEVINAKNKWPMNCT